MIPQVQDDIKQDFTIETLPSRTFRMNHNNLSIIGTIDEIQAVEQAVFLILNTERYEWLIHSWDYGVELHNLIGKDVALSKQINMQVNGVDTDVSEIEILGSGVLKYNQFASYGPLQVDLQAGTNTITWTVIGYSVPNVDYVELYKVTE